jgi:signal transduction histidine kinase
MTVTALFTVILFFVIYNIVHNTVYNHLDEDLEAELSEISKSIVVLDDEFVFTNSYELSEQEHKQIEVNPTFVQIVDSLGNNIRRTSNLVEDNLIFHHEQKEKKFYNVKVAGSSVRQIQAPILSEKGKIKAFLIIAIPLEESALVLSNLKFVLFISYPIVLILLFSISRMIAGKIISPVNNIITTAEKITKENMNERISTPPRKDELYNLTITINSLLDRLEDTILRERQFTADASHELRTPISIIKGTLEVLIRKERNPEQYQEKIKYVISEVDRMANLVEQLLSLARFESGSIEPMIGPLDLRSLVNNILDRFNKIVEEKNIVFENDFSESSIVEADSAMTEIIIENIISNAIKYSDSHGTIKINLFSENNKRVFSITNYGKIILPQHQNNIFNRFYRVDQSRTSQIEGKGLGLAIVKRLVDLQGFSISVDSSTLNGTTFKIEFPS